LSDRLRECPWRRFNRPKQVTFQIALPVAAPAISFNR
jgi:hypothetical protein